ncbi:MbtH protein [Streptomyces sp. Amel2xB2]|uniref:MbtH family protein n=1 Tax=Streptomyces sp. Amel2xB2 TaxID=1305829 RepID=UPI000DBAD4AE|nr:MbtH family protein [Streptomyces sp. Amel2xB2]RAJ58795.1 MbtH protein [Streptomyces sp. Amel2xB2]
MAAFLGDDDSVTCVVVVNDAGQYSIWPPDRDVPAGWHTTGFSGSRSACLIHIDENWTDPTALRT